MEVDHDCHNLAQRKARFLPPFSQPIIELELLPSGFKLLAKIIDITEYFN